MPHRETIKLRSGRRTRDYAVELERPAASYARGEKLTLDIGGKKHSVRVEIPVDADNTHLYVV